VSEVRVPPSSLLHVHYRSCPDRPDSKSLRHHREEQWIAGILYGIFTLQVGLAIYMIVWSATGPITQFPSIPLDAYRMCLIRNSRTLTVLQMSTPLPFDVAVFALIIVQMRIIRSRYQGMSGPDILSRLSRDSEIYFGAIATSHFVIVVMFAVARVVFFLPQCSSLTSVDR